MSRFHHQDKSATWPRSISCSRQYKGKSQLHEEGYISGKPFRLLPMLTARETIISKVRLPYEDRARGCPSSIGFRLDNMFVDDFATIAWHKRRMQNMILAVGPGSPASIAMKTDVSNSSSRTSYSDDNDDLVMVDSENDDDGERLTSMMVNVEGGTDQGAVQPREHWTLRTSRHGAIASEMAQTTSNYSGVASDDYDDKNERSDNGEEKDNVLDKDDTEHTHVGDKNETQIVCPNPSFRRRRDSSSSSSSSSGRFHQNSTTGDTIAVNDTRLDGNESEESDFSSDDVSQQRGRYRYNYHERYKSSMQHGGCINTAAWLTCPWRLSLARHSSETRNYSSNDFIFSSSYSSNNVDQDVAHAIPSEETPTQLLTSGDDRLVKFWDVSISMGNASPLPGPTTVCPYSSTLPCEPIKASVAIQWKKQVQKGSTLSGMVHPLVTLQTGHRGNVFHATPIPNRPGKVVTCAADGYLHLLDVELQSTISESSRAHTIIISPAHGNNGQVSRERLLSRGGSMCFSHNFLDENSGLLCNERGLQRFDLRLPPQSQSSHSVLGRDYGTCKSCAVLTTASGPYLVGNSDVKESTYIFAGGTEKNGAALYDLRFVTEGDGTSRMIHNYKPERLLLADSTSVSGIPFDFPSFRICKILFHFEKDISRDKKELLVSYENDQIYTFPIIPHKKTYLSPTIEGTDECSNQEENDSIRELASYGGHLNRLTFLKCAKYAGPYDEYICTGSDSGHAWVYEKATGSVVSLLRADKRTCNGIVPHPTLPFFITYGIDSTAKLWRATTPIHESTDDSDLGRIKTFHKKKYDKSPIVSSWESVQSKLKSIGEFKNENNFSLLPDEIPCRGEDPVTLFPGLASIFFQGSQFDGDSPIENNLVNLSNILQRNYYTCVIALKYSYDKPVSSGLFDLKRRITLIRLRHQAAQLGLSSDRSFPWIMQFKEVNENTMQKDYDFGHNLKKNHSTKYRQLADLIPHNPSDWIPYDPELVQESLDCGVSFNLVCHKDFFNENYLCRLNSSSESNTLFNYCNKGKVKSEINVNPLHENCASVTVDSGTCTYDSIKALDFLHKTITLLKDTGNASLQNGNNHLAAHYYDLAIKYGAVVSMNFHGIGYADFLKPNKSNISNNEGQEFQWTSQLKTLINVRLNLSMALLKQDIFDPSCACKQARLAILSLKPFSKFAGKVITGTKLETSREGEPLSTYIESKTLQAKAYFRLGSAYYSLKDFARAVKKFESSISCTNDVKPDVKPDSLVLRRLADARQENLKMKKRHRKKFKFMFSGQDARVKDTAIDN